MHKLLIIFGLLALAAAKSYELPQTNAGATITEANVSRDESENVHEIDEKTDADAGKYSGQPTKNEPLNTQPAVATVNKTNVVSDTTATVGQVYPVTKQDHVSPVTVKKTGMENANLSKQNFDHLSEKEVFAKTVYGGARFEPEVGQIWVAWVVKNRARMNVSYWGGASIKDVCMYPKQFECWNGKADIEIRDEKMYNKIRELTDEIYSAPADRDPTNGADHYNTPDKQGYPPWTYNCYRLRKIGVHQFYKTISSTE